MALAKKPPARVRLITDQEAPELAQAVSLGLAVLRVAKRSTLSELDGELPPQLDLTDSQLDLLNAHLSVLSLIRYGPPGSGQKTITLAVCPDCGRWVLLATGGPSSTCSMTLGCKGNPVKASVAKKEV